MQKKEQKDIDDDNDIDIRAINQPFEVVVVDSSNNNNSYDDKVLFQSHNDENDDNEDDNDKNEVGYINDDGEQNLSQFLLLNQKMQQCQNHDNIDDNHDDHFQYPEIFMGYDGQVLEQEIRQAQMAINRMQLQKEYQQEQQLSSSLSHKKQTQQFNGMTVPVDNYQSVENPLSQQSQSLTHQLIQKFPIPQLLHSQRISTQIKLKFGLGLGLINQQLALTGNNFNNNNQMRWLLAIMILIIIIATVSIILIFIAIAIRMETIAQIIACLTLFLLAVFIGWQQICESFRPISQQTKENNGQSLLKDSATYAVNDCQITTIQMLFQTIIKFFTYSQTQSQPENKNPSVINKTIINNNFQKIFQELRSEITITQMIIEMIHQRIDVYHKDISQIMNQLGIQLLGLELGSGITRISQKEQQQHLLLRVNKLERLLETIHYGECSCQRVCMRMLRLEFIEQRQSKPYSFGGRLKKIGKFVKLLLLTVSEIQSKKQKLQSDLTNIIQVNRTALSLKKKKASATSLSHSFLKKQKVFKLLMSDNVNNLEFRLFINLLTQRLKQINKSNEKRQQKREQKTIKLLKYVHQTLQLRQFNLLALEKENQQRNKRNNKKKAEQCLISDKNCMSDCINKKQQYQNITIFDFKDRRTMQNQSHFLTAQQNKIEYLKLSDASKEYKTQKQIKENLDRILPRIFPQQKNVQQQWKVKNNQKKQSQENYQVQEEQHQQKESIFSRKSFCFNIKDEINQIFNQKSCSMTNTKTDNGSTTAAFNPFVNFKNKSNHETEKQIFFQ